LHVLLSAMFAIALLPIGSLMAASPVMIIFVDTGNTGRSVTAEALANQIIAEKALPAAVISRAVDLNPFFIRPEPNASTLLRRHPPRRPGHHPDGETPRHHPQSIPRRRRQDLCHR
jgi:protein-tyrosine-phosphatase